MRYFLDHAQYNSPVQALAAFVNIQLPFQRFPHPILSSRSTSSPPGVPNPGMMGSSARATGKLSHHPATSPQPSASITVLPYIRRLVATGCDNPAVLHGFFGDDWSAGIGWLHEQERRNYLFAAKSDSWLRVKSAYDIGDDQIIPFLRPLRDATEKEIVGAEASWSEWLAMQDWMLGPRAPEPSGDVSEAGIGARGAGVEHHQPHGAARTKREAS